jgi:hypothetical protein
MQNSGKFPAHQWAGKWIVVAFIVAFGLSGQLFAKPAGCPCSPCTCSPCTCGGGGGSSGSKGGKHHHDGDSHHGSSVGGGMSVDLGGVGQRHHEADPFAVGGSDAPKTSHTQEKHVATTKKHEHEGGTTTDPFRDVHLTGTPAKAVAQGDTTPAHD